MLISLSASAQAGSWSWASWPRRLCLGCRTLLFLEGLLGGGHGCGSLFALQAACPGGVQEFGDSPPGTGAALVIWVWAEAPQQLHPGPCRLVLCDQHKKPVLVADGELRDVRGQRACIVLHRRQRRTGLGRDLEKAGIEAEEVGKGALRSGE